ncbi:hypothetical protein FXE99_06155 [Vibrio mimicus]|nr:hypothetical protein FXE99_06155 [Vibrio mimicus]
MFRVDFHLYLNEISWSASIHQLNSDILKRNKVPKIRFFDKDLHFSFCEETGRGEILDGKSLYLGIFIVRD